MSPRWPADDLTTTLLRAPDGAITLTASEPTASELPGDLAGLSAYAALDPPGRARAEGGGLEEPAALLEHIAGELATRHPQVVASVAFQCVTSRLAASVVLANGALGRSLAVPLASVRWRPERLLTLGLTELTVGAAVPWTDCVERLVEGAFRPWVAAVRATTPIGSRNLWGNAAASLLGAVSILIRTGARTPDETADLVAAIVAGLPRADLVEIVDVGPHGVRFKRRTCCLIYLVPDGQCEECRLVDGRLPVDVRQGV